MIDRDNKYIETTNPNAKRKEEGKKKKKEHQTENTKRTSDTLLIPFVPLADT